MPRARKAIGPEIRYTSPSMVIPLSEAPEIPRLYEAAIKREHMDKAYVDKRLIKAALDAMTRELQAMQPSKPLPFVAR